MSGPATRPPAWREPIDYVGMAEADNGSSVSQSNTWNINSPLPWIVLSIVISCLSIGLAFSARDRALLAEREARIIEDDTKYIRAYLSARGIDIPANHEEAEDK